MTRSMRTGLCWRCNLRYVAVATYVCGCESGAHRAGRATQGCPVPKLCPVIRTHGCGSGIRATGLRDLQARPGLGHIGQRASA